MDCNTQLTVLAHFFQQAILTRTVGHTDQISGVPSAFISRSAHARLQVFVCSGDDLYYHC